MTIAPAPAPAAPMRRPFALAPPRTASILGLGAYLPDAVLTSDAIARRLGVDEHWIVKRTGIHERRCAAPTERTSDLATVAAAARARRRRADRRGRRPPTSSSRGHARSPASWGPSRRWTS